MSLFGGKRRDGGPEPGGEPEPRAPQAPLTPAAPPLPQPVSPVASERSQTSAAPRAGGGENMANIGKSIVIKGDLSGNEDLVVEGKVEGRIDLPNNRLTVGAGGQVNAELHAKSVVVIGRVTGNVNASERLEVQASGIVEGDVKAPRLVVQEGAVLNGSIEMSTKEARPQPVAMPTPASSVSPTGEARKVG